MRNILFALFLLVVLMQGATPVCGGTIFAAGESPDLPILLYHRFGPVAVDGMTVTTPVFESHLKYLKENGYTVIPLRMLVDYYMGKGPVPPQKSVVIAADDGHESVYTHMQALVKQYRVPVTLFIYPSAISNASYAMTWDQLRLLKKTGLFDMQSHTYWHPNFKKEKKRMSISEFEKFADMQFRRSREKLQREIGSSVDMLAWPFGIYDGQLVAMAQKAGYVAAFTIEAHHATRADNIMRLPRYLLINADKGKAFEGIIRGVSMRRNVAY
jgi:peptidoglycan/xylan/chitin deacetylase (PgdA/CDA1 family)